MKPTQQSIILQTCVPHYRLGIFDLLAEELGSSFKVCAGSRFFDPTLQTAAAGRPWYAECENKFIAGNRALWQTKLPEISSNTRLIVEGNPRILSTWALLSRAKRRGARVAVWGHALGRHSQEGKMPFLRRILFSRADAIICYCRKELDTLKAAFPEKDILVAGNSNLSQRDCSLLPTDPAERHHVLLLGRLIPEKKGLLLLKALKLVQERDARIGLVVIGDGPDLEAMKAFTEGNQLQHVVYAGHQNDKQTIRELASRCFAMVSAGYAGLSVLHAQSMGLPFIYCRNEPNAPEIEVAQEDWNCLAFQKDSPASLAEIILKMHQNRNHWLERSESFITCIKRQYTIEGMAREFTAFFEASR